MREETNQYITTRDGRNTKREANCRDIVAKSSLYWRKKDRFSPMKHLLFLLKKARMLGLRSVSSLVHCSRLLRPTVPVISRVFSDATPSSEQSPEQTQEQGDPEVIDFIKKVMNILVLLFEDCK